MPRLAENLREQRGDDNLDAHPGEVNLQLLANGLQQEHRFRSGGRGRCVGGQPADAVEHTYPVEPLVERLLAVPRGGREPGCGGCPVLSPSRVEELRGHDAHDLERRCGGFLAHEHAAADRTGICAKALRPQRMAEDEHTRRRRLIIVAPEGSSMERAGVQDVEEGRGNRCTRHIEGLLSRECQLAAPVGGADARDSLEGLQTLEIPRRVVRELPCHVLLHRPQDHHAPGIVNVVRPQQDRLNDAEHDRAGSDPGGKDQDGDSRESPFVEESPDRISKVLLEHEQVEAVLRQVLLRHDVVLL